MCQGIVKELPEEKSKVLSEVPTFTSGSPQFTVVQTLSFIWFTLCTTLVVKDNDLVAIFYSFVASFVFAIAMMRSSPQSTFQSIQENGLNKKCRVENNATKLNVCMIFCTISLLCLISKKKSTVMELSQRVIKKNSEFHALANIAGYLAFDLWFDSLCCRAYPPRLWNTFENFATLSLFSTLLSKWDDLNISSFQITGPSIAIWAGYKIFRCMLEMSRESSVNEVNNNNTNEVNSLSISKQYLWTIYGKDYDLKEFVESHPGGKEAILLGMGRDCTALFESYHPFTNRHR